MRRRRALATLASGVAFVAGCSTRRDPVPTSTAEPTVPPDVTTVTERAPPPSPGDVETAAAARSFVATHERRAVYNDLVDGFGGSQPAIEVTVDSPRVAVVHATDRGHYLLSTTRGTARYYDPDGSPGGASRNAASVAHFVGDGVHRRIPFNGYRCREPRVAPADAEGDDTLAARFQIYDFETPPDGDPDRGGHAVDVTVTDATGETVLDREYRTSLPLTVQPRVTGAAGTYTLSASLGDGASARHEWSLSTPRSPAWWALAVLITNGGDVAVRTLYPNDAVGLPGSTLCDRASD